MSDLIKGLEEKLDGLLEANSKKVESLKNDLAAAQKEDKAELQKQIEDLTATIEHDRKCNQAYIESVRKTNVSLPGVNEGKDADRFSMRKFLLGTLYGDWSDAGFEKEVIDETRKKGHDTNSGAAGGNLIPVELALDMIIRPAIASTVVREAGTTFWEGLTGNIEVPETTSRPTLTWAADGVSATEQSITFALKAMNPKTGNMLCKVSNKLLKQTGNFAEREVRKMMQEGVADGLDNILLNGTGSSSQPLGIFNASGTNTTDVSSARMVIDDVRGMLSDLQEQNYAKRGGSDVKLITRPKVWSGLLRQLVPQYSGDTGGMPYVDPYRNASMPDNIDGIKVLHTTNVSVSSNITKAVMGEFKEFLAGIWGGASIKSSDVAGTSFQSNETWFVFFMDVDARVLRPLAFDIASNISTNF